MYTTKHDCQKHMYQHFNSHIAAYVHGHRDSEKRRCLTFLSSFTTQWCEDMHTNQVPHKSNFYCATWKHWLHDQAALQWLNKRHHLQGEIKLDTKEETPQQFHHLILNTTSFSQTKNSKSVDH